MSPFILRKYFLALCFVYALAESCGRPVCSCYNQEDKPVPVGETNAMRYEPVVSDVSAIRGQILLKGADAMFGFHITTVRDSGLLFFRSKDDSLCLVSLLPPYSAKRLPLHPRMRRAAGYNVLIQHDSLHFVSLFEKKYFLFRFTAGFDALTVLDSVDLAGSLTNGYLCTKPEGQAMAFSFPYVYMPWGLNNTHNYTGPRAFLRVSLLTKKAEQAGEYPACYRCSDVYDIHCSLRQKRDGSLVYLFNAYDGLFSLSDGNSRQESFIRHACRFEDFDKSREQNLAYIRKRESNGERNVALLNIADRYMVAVKREYRESLKDSARYTLYIFDSAWQQKAAWHLSHPVFIPCIFEYGKGFVAFNDSMNKMYYYDLSE